VNSPSSGMNNVRESPNGQTLPGPGTTATAITQRVHGHAALSSTSEVRIDEFDPVPIADGDFTIFLGIDKPPIVLDDQMAVIFAEKGNQGGNG
jgi:hypothetical protein